MDGIFGHSNPTFLTDDNSRNSSINAELVLNVLNPTARPALNRLVEDEIGIEVNNVKLLHFIFNNIGEAELTGVRVERPSYPNHIVCSKLSLSEVEMLTFCVLCNLLPSVSHPFFHTSHTLSSFLIHLVETRTQDV